MPLVLRHVLGVAQDFDALGGASAELAAWELGLTAESVTTTWQQAINEGLLAPAPPDKVLGEEMWRLTALGRLVLDLSELRQPKSGRQG